MLVKKVMKSQLLTTFSARGIAAGGTFLLSYVLATLVTVQAFGAFMLCLSVMIGVQVFTSLGTDRATLKFMGIATSNGNKKEVKWIYQRSMFVNILVGCLFSIFLWIFAPAIAQMLFSSVENGVDSLRVTAAISPFYSVIYLCNFLMKGWGRANVSCFFEIGCISIILSILVMLGSLFDYEFSALELILALGYILFFYLLLAVWYVLKIYKDCRFVSLEKVSFSRSFYKSLPDFLLVGIIFYYTQWGAGVVLGFFHDESDVAIFSLGLRLAMIIGFILTVYDSILGPRFSRLQHENDQKSLRELAQKSAFQMTCVAFLPAALFLVWPEAVLGLFGPDYNGASSVLRILVVAQLINVMTGSIILLLLMAGEQKSARNILIWSVVIGGLASLLLIPMYNANGAALSLLLCLLIQNVVAVYVVNKKFGFLVIDWREAVKFNS
ncbi:oligosaccharide flippase family protein [Halomonas sp. MC140]|nr:oligosaccharide flippase family protein [Halomonas sp. MC140]MDN7131937.1 oligosaccharide flippase family protein [Halomonas sp. MC140]